MDETLTAETALLFDVLDQMLAAAENDGGLSDDDAETLYALGYKALYAENFSAAEQIFSALQQYRPADPLFLAAHAQALRGLGRPEQAIGLRTLALMCDAGNPAHLFGLGEDLIAADERQSAREMFQMCAEAATEPEFSRLRERAQAMVGLLGHGG